MDRTEDRIALLRRIYAAFNARDIDAVMRELAPYVLWANAMEGGHEAGQPAVRAYWTRQWAMVRPTVTPVGFTTRGDDVVVAEVVQEIRDLEGQPIAAPLGLKDKAVGHVFTFAGAQVARFDVEDPG